MARKTREVRITAGTPETNRDHGKVYLLTEMSAVDAERWAADALHGLVAAGVPVPDDIRSAGTMGIATIGLRALGGMPPATMHDLMDRMMECVGYFPDPNQRLIWRGKGAPPNGVAPVGPLFPDDIEEVSTRLKLRSELFSLQVGFSLGDVKSLASQTAGQI